jgi:hypothetical protein
MRIRTRLFPEFDGETRFTTAAARSLIGQRPDHMLPDGSRVQVEVLDAAIEDGWVVVEFEAPDSHPLERTG